MPLVSYPQPPSTPISSSPTTSTAPPPLQQVQVAAQLPYGYGAGGIGDPKLQSLDLGLKFAAEANVYGMQLTAQVQAEGAINAALSHIYASDLSFGSSVYGSGCQATSAAYTADRHLEGIKYQTDSARQTQVTITGMDTASRQAIAATQANAAIHGDDQQLAGVKYSTDSRANVDLTQIAQTHHASIYGSDQDYASKVFAATANKNASIYGSDQDYAGRTYSADMQYAGATYGADQELAGVKIRDTGETGRLATKLAYAEGKFQLVWPVVQQSLDQALQVVGSLSTPITPGLKDWPALPFISTSGVLTPAQIQQQVNSAWAKNDSRTQAQILQTQRELAGRGFSSNSPLLEALKTGYLGQNLRANIEASTSIRIESAKVNAEAIYTGQKAVSDQFGQQQGVMLESEKNQVTRQVGLVGGLAQMISGLT